MRGHTTRNRTRRSRYRGTAMTDTEAPLLPLPEPIELVWPEMHSHALGCGVEDRGIRDRYEAAEYGWQDGVDKAASCVPEQVYDATQMCEYARACVLADRASRVSQQPALVEQLAQQWDGCMYETLGGAIDIGACIRDAGRRLSGDSVVPPVQPPGATLQPCAASQWQPIDTAPKDELVRLWSRGGEFHGRWGEFCRVNQPGITHWMRITPPTSQVERGESSSEGGQS